MMPTSDNTWQKPKRTMKAQFGNENQFVTNHAPFGTEDQSAQ